MTTPQATPYSGFAKRFDRDFDLKGGHSILIGPEYDKDLRARLQGVLLETGAVPGRPFDGMYTAEGIALEEWRLEGRLLTIESQSYIGLKLSGKLEDITSIAGALTTAKVPS